MGQGKVRLLCWIVGWSLAAVVAVVVGFVVLMELDLAWRVYCGKGICLTCAGKIDAEIRGEKGKCRYYVVDGKSIPPECRRILLRDVEYGAKVDRWIVVRYDHKFPVDELYWLSDDGMKLSKSGLWSRSSWFGRWILLSEVALNCTYDVRHDMKGLDAELEMADHGNVRRYVCRSSGTTGTTNAVFRADIPLSLLQGRCGTIRGMKGKP